MTAKALWVYLVLSGASLATAQTLRTETVLPQSTDPAITGWFGAHYAAIATDIPLRNQLFVYIHGQGGAGTGATELVKSAAELGFHAVGLTYPNDWSPFIVCGSDTACPENLRREIIDGTDRTPLITVTRPDSLENRLIKLLARLEVLHPGEAWTQFVDTDVLRWDLIVVWGHSQGGGNAAVIARHHALARCCMSAPAADGGAGNPAAWWADHVTPAERYFGFCHTQDQLSTKVAFWDALGMDAFGEVLDVVGSSPPYGDTHKLSASAAPVIANQYHNSVVADNLTPRDADNVPIYKATWQYMIAYGLDASPCSTLTYTPGDASADGLFDGRDIRAFAAMLGMTGPISGGFCAADLDHDGVINTADAAPLVTLLLGS